MRPRATCTVSLLLGFVSGACGSFQDQPYLIDQVTVAAIVAEPPEVQEGKAAKLTAYVVDPAASAAPIVTTWSYCADRGASQNSKRCSSGRVSLSGTTPTEVLPGVMTVSTAHSVDAAALTNVSSLILEAGFWEHVRLSVSQKGESIDAIKRIVVATDARHSNSNPTLMGVRVLADQRPLETPLHARAGTTLTLTPEYDAAAFETYRVLSNDGSWQRREEVAAFTWQVTGGKLDRWTTENDQAVQWRLPGSGPSTLTLFVVLRDGRGGTAVFFEQVVVE